MSFGLTGVEVRKIVKEFSAYDYIGQVVIVVKLHKSLYFLRTIIS